VVAGARAPGHEADRPRAAPAVGLALLLGLPAALLGLVVRDGPVLFDGPVQRALLIASGHPGRLMRGLDRVASLPVWTALVLAAGLLLALAGRRRGALVLVAADLSGEVVTLIVKAAIDRRAFAGGGGTIADALYPSGHVVRAVVGLVVLIALLPLARPARLAAIGCAAAFALAVGAERVASGAHLPTDVLGALLLGCAWASLVLALGRPAGRPASAARARVESRSPARLPLARPR
jgi:membrane-associated phospholipid phosphatase